jgi:hypothetical protein
MDLCIQYHTFPDHNIILSHPLGCVRNQGQLNKIASLWFAISETLVDNGDRTMGVLDKQGLVSVFLLCYLVLKAQLVFSFFLRKEWRRWKRMATMMADVVVFIHHHPRHHHLPHRLLHQGQFPYQEGLMSRSQWGHWRHQ